MPDALTVLPGDVAKLLAAFLVGGLIGAEREFHDKSAGLRTIILITVGACLLTIFSMKIAGGRMDPGRVAAQVVTGVGFLGAGVIMQRRGQVLGLTTASTIWIAAALGIGVGVGYILFSVAATVLALFVLWALPKAERHLEGLRGYRTYRVVCPLDPEAPAHVVRLLRSHGLQVSSERRSKRDGKQLCSWYVWGRPEDHRNAVAALMVAPEVKSFDY